jgi:hypothetical protein
MFGPRNHWTTTVTLMRDLKRYGAIPMFDSESFWDTETIPRFLILGLVLLLRFPKCLLWFDPHQEGSTFFEAPTWLHQATWVWVNLLEGFQIEMSSLVQKGKRLDPFQLDASFLLLLILRITTQLYPLYSPGHGYAGDGHRSLDR